MTNRAVFILAAGEGKRWHKGKEWPATQPKQLLEFQGLPLIVRTIRMVQQRGYDPIVVTHNRVIMDALPDEVEILEPKGRRWLIETLQSTEDYWRDINVALWSDVIYSDAVIDAMLIDDSPVKFYGRWGDGYGIVWRSDNELFAGGIAVVLHDAKNSKDDSYSVGRNWELYRWFQGWDLHTHIGPIESNEYYELVPYEDYTRDIDKPEDWEVVLRKPELWGIA